MLSTSPLRTGQVAIETLDKEELFDWISRQILRKSPEEAVESPSLKLFKDKLYTELSGIVQGELLQLWYAMFFFCLLWIQMSAEIQQLCIPCPSFCLCFHCASNVCRGLFFLLSVIILLSMQLTFLIYHVVIVPSLPPCSSLSKQAQPNHLFYVIV